MQDPENINFVLCDHARDQFQCKMPFVQDTRIKKTGHFSCRSFFVSDHLMKNGWKIAIKCSKEGCSRIHQSIQQLHGCGIKRQKAIRPEIAQCKLKLDFTKEVSEKFQVFIKSKLVDDHLVNQTFLETVTAFFNETAQEKERKLSELRSQQKSFGKRKRNEL